jgi:hypothetical protein
MAMLHKRPLVGPPRQLNGIDPEARLRFMLARLADHVINRIDQLTSLPISSAQ